MNNYVRIFDTTLRDGEQSPGATLTSSEKLEIARGLARLGVDVIEAGFPAASPDDLEAVSRIAREVGNPSSNEGELGRPAPIICGLARAVKERYRCCLGSCARCGAPKNPHLSRHLSDPHALQTAHGSGGGGRPRARNG